MLTVGPISKLVSKLQIKLFKDMSILVFDAFLYYLNWVNRFNIFQKINNGKIRKHALVDVICKLEMRMQILNNRLISRLYQDVAAL